MAFPLELFSQIAARKGEDAYVLQCWGATQDLISSIPDTANQKKLQITKEIKDGSNLRITSHQTPLIQPNCEGSADALARRRPLTPLPLARF